MINNPEKMQSKESIASPQQSVTTSFRLTELGLIPEDWDVVSIHEIADIRVGKDVNEKRMSTEFDNKFCYPVFSNTVDEPGIYGYYDYAEYLMDAVTVVGRGVGLGTAICRSGGFGAIGRLIVLFPKGNIIFLSNYINHAVDVFNESSGVPQLTGVALGNCKIAWPSLKEQIAIAGVLSDTDALITELEKLIAKKQAIKTATMQQLLTGRTRLPQFAKHPDGVLKGNKPSELGLIPEDWICVKLGEIGQCIIGLTYSPRDVSDTGTLVLRSSNVQNNKLAYQDNVFVNMDLPERVIVRKGDILICVRNGSRKLIGKCALIDHAAEGCAFGAFMAIYRTKAHDFIFYQFQSNLIHNQIDETMGATINQITNKDLSGFIISMPSCDQEQTAIATILLDMDAELEALEQKLAKIRDIKQGMMQQLLTGRIRLPLDRQP
ncbi:TPA: restriction endonuclease subunit S [Citrobacter freundii]|uniref:restriction endonuclease subunit S n=1 Tax=Enterobacterales TaxID=91347 RepID=UPI00093A1DF0|nr:MULTISPECIES: restriction endonuclease subunit S [Enterobacterales]EKU3696545.1 restriction endonuclease subunit S [Citrobacter freundii]EKV4234995.1 restriction endonuclease subunit S [Morganella morganii]EKX9189838.1 restriction endonuclease subunit S [Citrobacter freundii]ELL8928118.1 restriction endonuclease subunit S [Morganella morganii]ELY4880154.1 restriction endonuclease subunit S [Morganella morganii]